MKLAWKIILEWQNDVSKIEGEAPATNKAHIQGKAANLSCLTTKRTKWPVCPAKTQISLGIHPVWSVFAVRMKKHLMLSYPFSALRRLWSDWADAQADLSVRWVHMPFCWFCHEVAHLCTVMILNFWTEKSGQTVQTQIRLLQQEQSDQGLHHLPFSLHLLDA